MKKICFFSGDINRSGGTERVSTVIANNLNKEEYEVFFLSLENGLKPFFNTNNDVKLKSLYMEGQNKSLFYFKIIKKLNDFLSMNTIDYIIDIDIILSIYSIPASLNIKTKVISWEHFNYFAKVGNRKQNILRQIGRYFASKKAYKIITLTDKDKSYYIDNLSCKCEVKTIYNPLTIDVKNRSKLEEKIILAAGRLTYQKGFDLLIKAWNKVENKDGWKLNIVGSGEDKNMLENLINSYNLQDSIILTPNTDNISYYYENSSLFVLSSRYEGFGLVLCEAKAHGLPLISFDCDCGPSDIMRNNIDGYLVEPNNIIELAKKIEELILNKKNIIQFSKNALKDQRFLLSNIIKKWEIILK